MEEPKSLDSLFKEKIFRIPDYQRGYAWKHDQLKDFWEDLVNLPDDRSHYTGVLTLRCNDFLTAALGISREAQASWPPVASMVVTQAVTVTTPA